MFQAANQTRSVWERFGQQIYNNVRYERGERGIESRVRFAIGRLRSGAGRTSEGSEVRY